MQRWKGIPFADIPATFVFDNYTQVNATWQPVFEEMQAIAKSFFEKCPVRDCPVCSTL